MAPVVRSAISEVNRSYIGVGPGASPLNLERGRRVILRWNLALAPGGTRKGLLRFSGIVAGLTETLRAR
jgi:hypothetical protein